MSDEFKEAKIALAKLHEKMEARARLAKTLDRNVIEQMERRLETIRRQQLEMSRALEISGVAARMKEFVGTQQHFHELMIKQSTATSRFAESFTDTHQSWLERIKLVQNHFSQLQASATLALCDASLKVTATERLMAGINFEAIRSRFQFELQDFSVLRNSIFAALTSYQRLGESIRQISDITRLPTFVLPGATREIYTTSVALKTLRPWEERYQEETETDIQLVSEAERETSGCIALLQQVDPGLARPYIGAREALHSNNADHARHILSSLRELWNHLLRQLAPDDLVLPWIPTQNQKDLLHKDKPTRRARVLYICRKLNNGPLTNFLMDDTRALVKLIELFNQVHKLETGLTDEQLKAIVLKNDSWLMYILQISAGNFPK